MAHIVAAFLLPHDPLIAANNDSPPPEKRSNVMRGFATIAARLAEEKVDTVITIGDDHYTIFSPACLPRCLIGIGDVEGPVEQWLGIEREPIPTHPELATHIMRTGFDMGIDWSVSKSLVVDHSAMVPIHFAIRPNPWIRTIPIYLASGVEPLISSRRAQQIGHSIGEAVRSWPGDERVAIFGTGGISHWVGMAEMGRVNESWDREILAMAARGDIEALVALSDEAILADAGNGALEIKNWICGMAAAQAQGGKIIAYEPVPEWICGCGFVDLELAAA